MNFKNKLRKWLIDVSGYWIYKRRSLSVGTNLSEDIQYKLKLNIKTVFDVGANVGQTALWYNNEFKNVKIFSFEPVKSTFDLCKNRVRNFNNIICENIAFGDKEEEATIKLFPENMSNINSLNPENMNNDINAKEELIKVSTIDIYTKQKGIKEIDVLKIDTEGYEIAVLKGAKEIIEKNKIKLIYCEVGFSLKNKRNTYFQLLNDFLEEQGFRFYAIYEISHEKIKEGIHYGNALFINSNLL